MTGRTQEGAAPAVCVEHLTVVRGRTRAVDDVSFELGAGTLVGLLGPSGCGKTTLMRSLVGTQVVSSGAVSLLGEPAGSPGLRDRVGYVTQVPSVYEDLTVRENLSYFAIILGAPAEAVERVLADVDLHPHAGSIVGRLSGGERGACVARNCTLGFAQPSRTRRTDGRPRPAAAPEPVVAIPPVGILWDDPARFQPRHGRS